MDYNDVIIALIGVGGTLLGTIIGWLLSALSYRIGKITIYSDFCTVMHLPAISLDGSPVPNLRSNQTEYLFKCVASNSKQVPVLLKNIRLEMRRSHTARPIILHALTPEEERAQLGTINIIVPTQFNTQRLEPRTLTEFTIKANYNDSDIQFSKIDLIAYTEKNRKKKFHIYNGLKLQKKLKS